MIAANKKVNAANKKVNAANKKVNAANKKFKKGCVRTFTDPAIPLVSKTFPAHFLLYSFRQFMLEEEGMFCAGCGARFIADARFCEVCGLTKGVKDEDNTILTFDEYRDRKRKERSSRFVSKSVKKVKKENSENEVTIQIGLIRLKDGQLKAIRGSSLPLKVFPSIGAEELLRKGAEKMVKFNSDLSLYGASSFTLLYPDRTEVKCLPGGTEPFTLQRYKEELGKAYGRITLYLCKTTAIMDALFLKSYYSDESDVSLPTYEEV